MGEGMLRWGRVCRGGGGYVEVGEGMLRWGRVC